MRTCIGVDVGRSSTKIVATWEGKRIELLMPSAAVKAFALSDEIEAKRAAKETVSVQNTAYFFGNTAALQGGLDLNSGMSSDWALQDIHSALFLGALKKLESASVPNVDSAVIVVGLPAELFAAQKVQLTNLLSSLVPDAKIHVKPQSLGPFQQLIFTPDGLENGDINPDVENWGVIEVGQFTTDFAMLIQGRPVENAFDSCPGMRIAAEALQRSLHKRNIHIQLQAASEALETKKIKNFGSDLDIENDVMEAIQPLCVAIMNKTEQVLGHNARGLNGILVAGGGAPLIAPVLKTRWPHVVMTENPRFSVADGFCRYAVGYVKYIESSSVVAEGTS